MKGCLGCRVFKGLLYEAMSSKKMVEVPLEEWDELKRGFSYLKGKVELLEKQLKKR
jgi:hypothetical protein